MVAEGLASGSHLAHAPPVPQHMRYFADSPLELAALKRTLGAEDSTFKIDGGEVSRGGVLLAEIEINSPGSDMFTDDIAGMLDRLHAAGATHVLPRVQQAQAVLAVQILDEAPDAMTLLGPFWSVLSRMSTGLWHVESQGLYDQGQLVAQV